MQAAADLSELGLAEDRRAERRRAQMAAWRRRSRLIHRMRRLLPIGIACVLVLLTGWVLVKGLVSGLGDGRSGGAKIHMTNARFYGRDGEGRPYILGALEAFRQGGDIVSLKLDKPSVTYNAEGIKPTIIAADRGVYREDNRLLSLSGHVTVADDAGDVFQTPSALVDTQTSVVNGWNGVTGKGPRGTITARAYGVYDRGQRIVFSGDVHSIIKPD